MKPYVDVVVGLSFGDESKGKVTYNLAKSNDYDVVARHCGSQNSGHQIMHHGVRYTTHIIPAGVFYNKLSVIGPLCYFHVPSLWQEIDSLEKCGINVTKNLKIAYNSHIITNAHIAEEAKETAIGTTRRGVGPCARDKFARTGIRAESIPELNDYLVDTVELFNDPKYLGILFEGAQGYYLDINNSRDYPYCTSSDITLGSVIASGVSPFRIHNIYGVCKAYDTYVGARTFEDTKCSDAQLFRLMRDRGVEFGATTGRPRQCNWLNLDKLIYAAKAVDITHLYMNKCDILEDIGVFRLYHRETSKDDDGLVIFDTFKEMQSFIELQLSFELNKKIDIIYGYAP